MKSCVILIAFCLVVAADSRTVKLTKEKLLEYRKYCEDEKDISRQAMKNDNGYYSAADGSGCITACISKRIGLMNTDGSFNLEVARSTLPDIFHINNVQDFITAQNFIAKCMNHTEANDCETGFQMIMCFMENIAPINPGNSA